MGLSCTLHALSKVDASALLAGDRAHQTRMLDSCELDRAWGAIHYFISGSGDISPASPQPKDFLVSGAFLEGISEHAAIHTHTEVAAFANEVKSLAAKQLIDRFDPGRMNQFNVYGGPWDESGREYVVQFVEPFRQFIIHAAEADCAVLVVIC